MPGYVSSRTTHYTSLVSHVPFSLPIRTLCLSGISINAAHGSNLKRHVT
jgi:hypothetical protein